MEYNVTSIRAFIGAKDYELSRNFYLDLGFEERITGPKMSYFRLGNFGFYLQDAYVKDWVNNSMLFLEVKDLESHLLRVKSLELENTYKRVRPLLVNLVIKHFILARINMINSAA